MAATDPIRLIRMVADLIEETAQEAGSAGAPSGIVYATLSSAGLSLDAYRAILASMEQHGRISVRADVIYPGMVTA